MHPFPHQPAFLERYNFPPRAQSRHAQKSFIVKVGELLKLGQVIFFVNITPIAKLPRVSGTQCGFSLAIKVCSLRSETDSELTVLLAD